MPPLGEARAPTAPPTLTPPVRPVAGILRAMSILDPEQLQHFKHRLEQLSEQTSERLRASQDSARPVDLAEPIGRLSRMDALQAQQVARSQRTRDEGQLQMIRSALARLRQGTYGECLKCGEAIALERLEVAPESPVCVTCRREREGS
jgi:DnaK suppressor protein